MADKLVKTSVLTLAQIKQGLAAPRRYREIDMPEWGGKVRIQAMTARERTDLELMQSSGLGANGRPKQDRNAMREFRGRLLAASIVDFDGNRMFNNEDIGVFLDGDSGLVERLVNAAMDLSGLSPQDVENLVGNSESVPNGASSSA